MGLNRGGPLQKAAKRRLPQTFLAGVAGILLHYGKSSLLLGRAGWGQGFEDEWNLRMSVLEGTPRRCKPWSCSLSQVLYDKRALDI